MPPAFVDGRHPKFKHSHRRRKKVTQMSAGGGERTALRDQFLPYGFCWSTEPTATLWTKSRLGRRMKGRKMKMLMMMTMMVCLHCVKER